MKNLHSTYTQYMKLLLCCEIARSLNTKLIHASHTCSIPIPNRYQTKQKHRRQYAPMLIQPSSHVSLCKRHSAARNVPLQESIASQLIQRFILNPNKFAIRKRKVERLMSYQYIARPLNLICFDSFKYCLSVNYRVTRLRLGDKYIKRNRVKDNPT